jgi:hypothetical protein
MTRRGHRLALTLAALVGIAAGGMRLALAQPELAPVRFAALAIFVDSSEPLAAWQFELSDATGAMTVVGVENGDSPAFAEAPHYDLAAVAGDRADRIIVADYSLAEPAALPAGRIRVATVHVRLSGNRAPVFELQLMAAGNAAGRSIAAEAVYELNEGRAE